MEIDCPHCKQKIWIEELNCGIFRCGVLKETNEQIPPHASKEECEAYLQKGIYGCGKPFQIIEGKVIVCDYI
jgi:DNA-directed RNA polymerase subunit RPC12/RpoP